MRRTVLLILVLSIFSTGGIVVTTEAQIGEESYPQTMVMEVLTPDYISPSELVKFLGTTISGGTHYFFCNMQNQSRPVQIRYNDAANVVMLTGAPEDVSTVKDLVKSADIPPRQIIIETQIIEVDQEQLDDLGIDWEDLLQSSGLSVLHSYSRNKQKRDQESNDRRTQRSITKTDDYETDRTATLIDDDESHVTTTQTSGDTRLSGTLRFDRFLNIIAESGAGTIHNAPRIVTINNRPAKILDGERVTYVTRYSSYTNLFETQTMDAGLSLYVLPSLGQSGYLTLDITAELTSLGSSVSGSPVKQGQILENTAVVKDGETFLLGGLSRSVDYVRKRKVPLLGTILPFLFSRKITTRTNYEVFILLTPTVIDLEPQKLDERLKGLLKPDQETP